MHWKCVYTCGRPTSKSVSGCDGIICYNVQLLSLSLLHHSPSFRWFASRDYQGWFQGYVIGGGGGVKANLTNSHRLMLRFDQLESVNVDVWPTWVGQCWGLTNSDQSVLRYDQFELVNVEVWPTRILLLNKMLALAIFDGPTQSGFDQLSQQHWGGGGNTPPPPPPWSHPWGLLILK